MAKPLTILQLLPALESGGVERGTLEIAAGLVAAGHRSLVISGGGQLVPSLTGQGSEHFTWPIGKKSLLTFGKSRALRKFIKKQQVDVVHARSRMPAWVAYRAWKSLSKRKRPGFVTTVHGLYSVKRYSSVMTRGERVIAVSQAAVQYLGKNYPRLDESRIRLIERGIDQQIYQYGYRPTEAWLRRWYSDFPFLVGRKVLILPGRITRRKGHLDFIEMMGQLVKSGKPVYGLIVGGNDSRHVAYVDELHKAIEKHGLWQHITFTGSRMDLCDIMAVSSMVFSLSTKPESFGRTVQEALSLGVPVVAYDHGGVSDLLKRAFPAGRVMPGNVDNLEQTVNQLLVRPVEVTPNNFQSVQDMVDATIEVYRELGR
jgi:glycosyltransferase involved in cell wall biosynthesis